MKCEAIYTCIHLTPVKIHEAIKGDWIYILNSHYLKYHYLQESAASKSIIASLYLQKCRVCVCF